MNTIDTYRKAIEADKAEIIRLKEDLGADEAGDYCLQTLSAYHRDIKGALWSAKAKGEAQQLLAGIEQFAREVFPDRPTIIVPLSEQLNLHPDAKGTQAEENGEAASDFFEEIASGTPFGEAVQTAKRGRGRPPGTGRPYKADEDKCVPLNTSIRADQREKFERLGGAEWLQGAIDKA